MENMIIDLTQSDDLELELSTRINQSDGNIDEIRMTPEQFEVFSNHGQAFTSMTYQVVGVYNLAIPIVLAQHGP